NPSWEDFCYYMGPDGAQYGVPPDQIRHDSPNKTARSNLAAGDVRLIEEAFGFSAGALGINGGSSVHSVVAAAMSPLGNAWKNEVLVGQRASTEQIYHDIRSNGYTSAWAEG